MDAAPNLPRPRWAALVLTLLFALASIAYILSGHRSGAGANDTAVRAVFDQELFHLRVIRTFKQQWPAVDLSDYRSATTPLYHALLAGVDRIFGGSFPNDLSRTTLRLISLTFSLAFIWTFSSVLARRTPWPRAVALGLPVICSSYIFSSAVYLLPDNAAWWGVLALIALALTESFTLPALVLAGSTLVLLVLTRQVHLWAAAPIVLAAFLGHRGSDDDPSPPDPRDRWHGLLPPRAELAPALFRAALAAVACVPACVVLWLFVRLWGGLTPPAFSPLGSALTDKDCTNVSGLSPISPGYILAIFGVYGLFYLPTIWPALRAKAFAGWAAVGALGGLLLASVGPSTFQLPQRIGGLFSAARVLHDSLHVPALFGRSPVVLLPAAMGGAVLAMLCCALPRRDRWILLCTLAAFSAAQSAGALTWLRYIEPLVLMVLALGAARCRSDGAGSGQAWRLAGPVVLAGGLVVVTVLSLRI